MSDYDFMNKVTGEVKEYSMSYTKLEEFKAANPDLEMYFGAAHLPVLSDAMRMSVPGTKKADSSFEKYVVRPLMERVGENTMKSGHKTICPREWQLSY